MQPVEVSFKKPFKEQIEFLLAKVNVPSQGWTDVWHEAHDTGFMIAGAYKADLLADLRGAVNKAITETRSLDDFRKDFDKIVAQRGWSYNGGRNWRTRVIYETNMRTSYQAGRYAQLTDPDLISAAPFWRYKHSDLVSHPRPQHQAWNGIVLRHDDPWWKTHYPPNGWGCRCTVFATSKARAEREGYTVSDSGPPLELEDKVVGLHSGNPKTVRVPKGIDPGWDYAPGASNAERLRARVLAKAAELPKPIASDLKAALKAIPAPPPVPTRSFQQPLPADLVPDFSARVDPDISTAARRAAVRFEDKYRGETREWGTFFDAKGNQYYTRQGDLTSLTYSEDELELMRGMMFSHVHPGGGTFSAQDVYLAIEYGLTELRVVTDRLRYSIVGLDHVEDLPALERAVRAEGKRLSAELNAAYKGNEISPNDLELYGDHALWLRIAKAFGLTYRREVS